MRSKHIFGVHPTERQPARAPARRGCWPKGWRWAYVFRGIPFVPGDALAQAPSKQGFQKKRQRQAIVDAITVTTSTNKVFDGNEEAQSRMSRAIQTAQIANIPSTTWVLANNVPTTVTMAELQEALVLSMQAMGAVWAAPYE